MPLSPELIKSVTRLNLDRPPVAVAFVSTPPAGLGLPVSGTSNKYTLSVSLASDGQTYIATASPVGAQAADLECLSFSVDARGRRAVSGAGGIRRCWR